MKELKYYAVLEQYLALREYIRLQDLERMRRWLTLHHDISDAEFEAVINQMHNKSKFDSVIQFNMGD